jgi:hypothetical protein
VGAGAELRPAALLRVISATLRARMSGWPVRRPVLPPHSSCRPSSFRSSLQLSAAGDAELAHIKAIVDPSFSKKIMSVDDAHDRCLSGHAFASSVPQLLKSLVFLRRARRHCEQSVAVSVPAPPARHLLTASPGHAPAKSMLLPSTMIPRPRLSRSSGITPTSSATTRRRDMPRGVLATAELKRPAQVLGAQANTPFSFRRG